MPPHQPLTAGPHLSRPGSQETLVHCCVCNCSLGQYVSEVRRNQAGGEQRVMLLFEARGGSFCFSLGDRGSGSWQMPSVCVQQYLFSQACLSCLPHFFQSLWGRKIRLRWLSFLPTAPPHTLRHFWHRPCAKAHWGRHDSENGKDRLWWSSSPHFHVGCMVCKYTEEYFHKVVMD